MRRKKDQAKPEPTDDMFVETDSGVSGLPDSDYEFEPDLVATAIKWKPNNVGDSIVGVFKGLEKVDTPTKTFMIGLLLTTSSEIISVSGHALTEKLLPMYPVGVTIKITYIGDIDTHQPEKMKNFRIDVAKKDLAKVKEFRAELKGDSNALQF